MKYVWIIAALIVLVRIDLILKYYDKTVKKFEPTPTQGEVSDVPETKLISVVDDANLKQTPKKTFFALLETFQNSPEKQIKDRAIEELRANPTLFTDKLDPQLEAAIFRWRDLLILKNHEVGYFLLELSSMLQGENQEMIKRFLSVLMDLDINEFLFIYSKSKDPECTIAKTFSDSIADDVKLHTLEERQESLIPIAAREKLDPIYKMLAENCLAVIRIEVAKMMEQPQVPEASQPEPAPQAPDPAQMPMTPTTAPEQNTSP